MSTLIHETPDGPVIKSLATREELAAMVLGALADYDGDARDCFVDPHQDFFAEVEPARCASSELDAITTESGIDEADDPDECEDHAEGYIRAAVLLLHSAAAWRGRAQAKRG